MGEKSEWNYKYQRIIMQKLWKIFEYGYLIIAVIFLIETVLNWNENRERAYLLFLFSVVAIIIYIFRKRFRKRVENRNK